MAGDLEGDAAKGTAAWASLTTELDAKIRQVARSFGGRKVTWVKVRDVDGRRVQGFLGLRRPNEERFLVDFEAELDPDGEISLLKVAGRRVRVSARAR